MNWDSETNLTRRGLLAASTGLLVSRWLWAENRENLVLCWKLEETGDAALESVSGKADAIASRTGHAIWVGSGRDRALRLDGYSVWIHRGQQTVLLRGQALSIAAWLALESYPVDEAAIVQLGNQPDAEFRFSIDKWGYVQFGARQAGVGAFAGRRIQFPRQNGFTSLPCAANLARRFTWMRCRTAICLRRAGHESQRIQSHARQVLRLSCCGWRVFNRCAERPAPRCAHLRWRAMAGSISRLLETPDRRSARSAD